MPVECPEYSILNVVRGWLTEITEENGYWSPIDGRVFLEVPAPNETQLPFIHLLSDQVDFSGKKSDFQFYVIGIIPVSREGMETLPGWRMLWDIRKRIREATRADFVRDFSVEVISAEVSRAEEQSSILNPILVCRVSNHDSAITSEA